MKVCIYFEGINNIKKSGIGRAFSHQVEICKQNNIEYTTNFKDNYDILHINTIFLKSDEAIRYARKQNAKVIYHAHTTKEDFENSFKMSNYIAPGLKKWLIRLYSKADLILTPTEYSKKLIEGYGIKVPVMAISNGIDLTKYEPDINKEKEFFNYFNLKPEEKVFISVGLWFKRKGIIDFIELAKELPQYKFIWFGHIAKSSIPAEIVEAMDNKPTNCLFPGYIAGNVIQGAFSAATAFIFMSYEETEGIVVLEALASKQNVIIRDIPVYQDWLEDGKDVLKAKTIQDFKDKITYFVNNEKNEIRINGYEVAKTKDIHLVGMQMKKIYEYVLTLPEKKYIAKKISKQITYKISDKKRNRL
ncbi:glycosyltransferase family 4 protein [Mycoplasma sp. P36-A1]|uniref:glycosyltransferase family 4 protein n=1 Tax=Mycoplasma sp. P36-A1 TaxID=3252900 RepID=UPI003C2DB896